MINYFDFSDPHAADLPRLRWRFGQPLRTLVAHQPYEVREVLQAVQQAAEQGLWCLGWLAYEAASAFDAAYEGAVHPPRAGQPLAWFAVHAGPVGDDLPKPAAALPQTQPWQSALTRAQFERDVQQIHAAIAAGECYQINYTSPLSAKVLKAEMPEFETSHASDYAQALFARLQQAQPGGYVSHPGRS